MIKQSTPASRDSLTVESRRGDRTGGNGANDGNDALLAAQNRALEAAAGPLPLEQALNCLTRIVQEELDESAVAAIMLIDADGRRLRSCFGPGLPQSYHEAVDGLEVAAGVGTCVHAAACDEVVVTPDIAAAPSWYGIAHLPLELGLKAAWSMPIRGSDGKVLGTFGTYFRECREPTHRERQVVEGLCRAAALAIERRRAEAALCKAKEEAEETSRAKDRFLSVLSHELRTPLTPVVMTIAALESEPALPPHIRDDLAMIRRNIDLEAKLIDDLLDLSRVINGKMRLAVQDVTIDRLLASVHDMFAGDLHARRLRVVWDLGARRQIVRGDPARLHQVVWNLLRNAIKFTPEGGQITIASINPTPDVIRVSVQDTGAGIEPALLGRIFAAFEQGDDGVTRQFGGLGLGLAISKALVEMHGGTIRAESAGRDKGARFSVDLPAVAVADPAPARSGVDSPADGATTRLRVLLVEDHQDTLRMLQRLLEGGGFTVQTATSIAAAMRLLDAHRFDLMLSDVGLPDGSGIDLIRQIRSRGLVIPGIAVTGYGMESDVQSCLDAGFASHLTKPLDLNKLKAEMRRVTAPCA